LEIPDVPAIAGLNSLWRKTPTWAILKTALRTCATRGASMQKYYGLFLSFFVTYIIFDVKAMAGSSACYNVADASILNANDPLVVRGEGIFLRGKEQYPFTTFSLAERDTTDPKRVCFRYEIENDTQFNKNNNGSASQTIQAFRWKDIGLEFVNIDNSQRFKWQKVGFTNYDELQVAASSVAAFENSPATTTTILSTEDTNSDTGGGNSGKARPIRTYRITENFPSTVSPLKEAHIPATPVISVSNASARDIKPIVNRIIAGDLVITVSNRSFFKGDRYALETEIDLGGRSSNEVELYAPTLPFKSDGELIHAVTSDDMIQYIQQTRNNLDKSEKKEFGKDGFFADTFIPVPKSASEPAFFIVDYPIALQTKLESICVVISGFSAYPINVNDWYCKG
jgi:hypothetical protein